MANSGDKQIKFTFAVDQRAFNQTRTAIRELTSEVKKLVETAQRAGQAMGGVGGGMMGGVSGRAGGINTQTETIRTPGMGGGVANGITSAVLANKNLLKGAAEGSRDAFKIMSDGVRTAIGVQTREIDKLQQKLRSLGQTYGQIKENYQQAMGPGGSMADRNFSERQMNEHRQVFAETTQQLNKAMAAKSELDAMDSNPYAGIMGRGKRNARARAAVMGNGWGEPNEFEGAAAPQGWMSQLGGLAGKLGYTGTGLGGGLRGLMRAAGPGLAIAGGYEALNQMQLSRDAKLAEYTLWQGTDRQTRAAQTNQAVGGMGMRMKTDASFATAASRMTAGDIAGVIGREAMSARLTQAYQAAGGGGGLGSAKEDMQDWVARVMDASEENLSAKDASIRAMAMDKATAGLDVQAKQALVEQVGRKHEAMNLQEREDINYYAGAASSRLAMQRAYGSGKKRFVAGEGSDMKWTPQGYVQGTYMSAAMTAGDGTRYSSEEIAGQMSGLRSSIGGRFASEGLAGQMIGLGEGGLGNAAQLYGNAAGYGNAGAFLSAVTGAGRMGSQAGYVDAPAAAQIAQLYQSQMMGGDMFTSGQAGMEGMMAVGGMMGGDLRAARAMQGGAGVMGAYTGGTTDNLQRGINVLSAVNSGAKGVVTQEALMGMSEAQRMDILRSGKLPEELRMQGVTMDMLKSYGKNQDHFLFARGMRGQGLSSDVEAQMNAFENKGFDSLNGLKGGDLKSAFKRLGIAAMRAGHGKNIDEGMAFMAQRAASENPELFKALKKGGIGVGIGDDELQQKVEDDREKRRREADSKAQAAALAATSPEARAAAQAAMKEGAGISGSVKNVSGVLNNLATAVKSAASALDKMDQADRGRTKAGAPGHH